MAIENDKNKWGWEKSSDKDMNKDANKGSNLGKQPQSGDQGQKKAGINDKSKQEQGLGQGKQGQQGGQQGYDKGKKMGQKESPLGKDSQPGIRRPDDKDKDRNKF